MLLHHNRKNIWSVIVCCAVFFCVLSGPVMAEDVSVSLLHEVGASRVDGGVSVTMPMGDCASVYAAAYSEGGKMLGVTALTDGAGMISCDPVLATEVRFFQLEAGFVPAAPEVRIDITEEEPMEAPGYTHELLSFYPSYNYVAMAFRYTGEGTEWDNFEINSIRVNGLECDVDVMSRSELAEQLADAGVTLEEAGCERAFIAAHIHFDYTAAIAAATEYQEVEAGYYEPVLAFEFDVSGEMADGGVHTENFTIRYVDYGYGGWL